jgi:hypothetical protein
LMLGSWFMVFFLALRATVSIHGAERLVTTPNSAAWVRQRPTLRESGWV